MHIPKELQGGVEGAAGQNPEPEGVTGKILRNKDLAGDSVAISLGVACCMLESVAGFRFSVKVIRHKEADSCCGELWKTAPTQRN